MHLDTGACAAPSEVAVDVLTNGQRRSYGYTASKPTKGAIPYEGIFTEIRAF